MNQLSTMSDEEVLTRFYDEEDEERADRAFAELDRRFRSRMLLSITRPGYHKGFVKLYNKPGLEHMAEELVTEALFRVAETRGRPSARWKEGRSVAPWIFGILHHVVVSFLRRKRARVLTDTDASGGGEGEETPSVLEMTPDRGPGPDETLQQQALLALLRECLQELPAEMRTICELLYQNGLKQTAIAERLGLSQPTLTRRKKEACDLLRQCLSRKGIAGDVLNDARRAHFRHPPWPCGLKRAWGLRWTTAGAWA